MRHNSVASGQPKSIGIPLVSWLSTGPSDFGYHNLVSELRFAITQGLMSIDLISNIA